MSIWRVEATIMPKDGVNDPQGEAIRNGLISLEFADVRDVRAGKIIAVKLEADTEREAIERGTRMCDQLLANPVIETYKLSATPINTTPKDELV